MKYTTTNVANMSYPGIIYHKNGIKLYNPSVVTTDKRKRLKLDR